ncbi:hypothetical protein HZS_3563 [Henneguya salminicola]|nr:hypothetical protein HZS_3563 [Henneguya salminicola]
MKVAHIHDRDNAPQAKRGGNILIVSIGPSTADRLDTFMLDSYCCKQKNIISDKLKNCWDRLSSCDEKKVQQVKIGRIAEMFKTIQQNANYGYAWFV